MTIDIQTEVTALLGLNVESITSEAEAQSWMDRLQAAHTKVAGALENQMSDLGLKFEISVYLGDYGSGRSLLLQDDEWGDGKRGDWISSSSQC